MTKILNRPPERFNVIAEEPERRVASVAEEPADTVGLVVVVDAEWLLGPVAAELVLVRQAKSTGVLLNFEHGVVVVDGEAVPLEVV